MPVQHGNDVIAVFQLYCNTASSHKEIVKHCSVIVSLTLAFFSLFFWIQFNVPFKIISLIETSQSIGGAKREYPGKPPETSTSRTWPVSNVASAGLEPTPDTAVR